MADTSYTVVNGGIFTIALDFSFNFRQRALPVLEYSVVFVTYVNLGL
jgi:hypothetical protein